MKIVILTLEPGHSNTRSDAPMYSWAVRELGAEVKHYKNNINSIDPLCDGADVVVHSTMPYGPHHVNDGDIQRAKSHCGRLVGLVSDAGDWRGPGADGFKTWRDENVYSAVVNIDGNPDWPHREGIDWTAFGIFDSLPWENRNISRTRRLGYAGAVGDKAVHRRPRIMQSLTDMGVLITSDLRYGCPFQQYIDWTLGCYTIVNTAWTGSGNAMHVKGRVNEAILGGCLLFETRSSPTALYLDPDEDYIEFSSPLEIAEEMNKPNFESKALEMGAATRAKMLGEYGPERFWQRVMGAT